MGQAGTVLTIGQLASYAGTTIRAVRHYHQVGLLPEPDRDSSGYRSYSVDAVVRLIRIRTLADAGVPLARVHELLASDAETFTAATTEIDRDLRRQIRTLQQHRQRIAQLASGDTLAVPEEVVEYLDRLRGTGAPEVLVEAERDAWILVAARYPDQIPTFMADKVAQLEDPRVVHFYGLIGSMLGADQSRQESIAQEMADLLIELFEEAAASGQLEQQDQLMDDTVFVQLLDSMADAQPTIQRLRELLEARGWTGWTKVERTSG